MSWRHVLSLQEQEELMEELKKEQEAEQEQLNSLLELEQTEQIEETRKVGKELTHWYLGDVAVISN